jgi:hypothetical protein
VLLLVEAVLADELLLLPLDPVEVLVLPPKLEEPPVAPLLVELDEPDDALDDALEALDAELPEEPLLPDDPDDPDDPELPEEPELPDEPELPEELWPPDELCPPLLEPWSHFLQGGGGGGGGGFPLELPEDDDPLDELEADEAELAEEADEAELDEPPLDVEVDPPLVEVEPPLLDVEPPLDVEAVKKALPLEPPKKPPEKKPPPKPKPPPEEPPTTIGTAPPATSIGGSGGSGMGGYMTSVVVTVRPGWRTTQEARAMRRTRFTVFARA